MLNLADIIKHTESTIASSLERAHLPTPVADVRARQAKPYWKRLVNACFEKMDDDAENDSRLQSLCVASPEFLFSGMYRLGYSNRKKNTDAPNLLSEYHKAFNGETRLNEPQKLMKSIESKTIDKALICHGLSSCDDTILLLADIGRSVRIAQALDLQKVEIMLADVSWIRHNRSLNKLFHTPRDFEDGLRVCIEKRRKLYRSLNLKYYNFGVLNVINQDNPKSKGYNITLSTLTGQADKLRELAKAIWGDRVFQPHDGDIQREIGATFEKLLGFKSDKRDICLTPLFKSMLAAHTNAPKELEETYKNQLTILRKVSNLFGQFDTSTFVYYFAQYFAQSNFTNYLKIANISEQKFDQPFNEFSNEFSALTGVETFECKKGDMLYKQELYLPWYNMSNLKILSYTSTSGDVAEEYDASTLEAGFFSSTILLGDDININIHDKIYAVLKNTKTIHRNRLISDILSFVKLVINLRDLDDIYKKNVISKIYLLSEDIGKQVSIHQDKETSSKIFLGNWLQAIGATSIDTIIPFHIIPYLWEEDDWTDDKLSAVTEVILETLILTRVLWD